MSTCHLLLVAVPNPESRPRKCQGLQDHTLAARLARERQGGSGEGSTGDWCGNSLSLLVRFGEPLASSLADAPVVAE